MTVEIQLDDLNIAEVLQVSLETGDDMAIIYAKPFQIRALCEEINEAVPYDMRMSKADIMNTMAGVEFLGLGDVIIKSIDPRKG